MKTKLYSIFFLLFALHMRSHSFAKSDDSEKKKTYTKSYSISNSDEITIENKFGETKLVTWSNNEVKVDVEITTKASTDERAQQMLDAIHIEDGKSGDGVYFKTKIDDIHSSKKDGHTEMKINYVVHLPVHNPLRLKTEFGNTIVPDYTGSAEIETKFGTLDAGNLSQIKELSVEFGGAEVESINNCKFTVKYSSFSVKKMSGDIDAKFEFCNDVKLSLDNNIKSFDLHNDYSEIKITTSKDISADFDIETHFGEFKNKSSHEIKEEKEKEDEWRSPRFDYHFSGKAGSGNIKVNVKSNFGTTTII